MIEQLRAQSVAADRWHVLGEEAIRDVRLRGAKSLSIAGARERKSVMDAFRQENAAFREHVHARAEAQLVRMQLVGLVLVIAIGALVLGGGLWLLERASRRAARRRAIEREFVETLQTAEDEAEVQDLLKRHVERSCEGTAAVVLNRNASGNVLTACTDPARHPRCGGPRWRAPGPRDCLAVRRGHALPAQRDRRPPLQPCGICGDLPGASRCTPSLVGGEVIGSPPGHAPLPHRRPGRGGPCPRAVDAVGAGARQSPQPRDRRASRRHRRAHRPAERALPCGRRSRAWPRRPTAPPITLTRDRHRPRPLQVAQRPLRPSGRGTTRWRPSGRRCAAGMRVSDFAGRWGGEEFVVLLPDTAVRRRGPGGREAARERRGDHDPRRSRGLHRQPRRRHPAR